ncbi:MAG: glutamate--tRNA ligase [Candidatus Aminicenantes bacterium]|nr:glutamate--tRNA ligase [Candidatus Aminicenantes bacterium]
MVRVRFAPSPTGHLHIGAARTALYNWLFARHHKGQFILRIEDTDVSRSSQKMTAGITKALQWLGLEWDEGPIYQSKRVPLYRQKAEQLVRQGHAYECYCSPDKKQTSKQWESRCQCFNLTQEEAKKYKDQGRSKAIRFKVPKGELCFQDIFHGEVTTKLDNIENFVLLRGDGLPTYHLSVVVDDIDQQITHVIRGDDHISNTPKQILVYKALEAPIPCFAHQSLILGKDKKKLSKRHGETSVLEFHDKGYLPLAVVNFLVQMSWSPGEERIYSLDELKDKFELDKRSSGHPVFDLDKLDWLNGQLISQMKAKELLPYVERELERADLWRDELAQEQKTWFLRVIDLLKPRNKRISDFTPRARPFLSSDYPIKREAADKYLNDERLPALLPKLARDFKQMDRFTEEQIEEVLRSRAEKEGVKAALFIHALRVIVLGMKVSPGIFEVLELMGKKRTLRRMEAYLTNRLAQKC